MAEEFNWNDVVDEQSGDSKPDQPAGDRLQDILEDIPESPSKQEQVVAPPQVEDHSPLPPEIRYEETPPKPMPPRRQGENQYVPTGMSQDLVEPSKETTLYETVNNESAFVAETSDAQPVKDIHIDQMLTEAAEARASDIHFTVGLPPMIRVDGSVKPLPYQPLTPEDTRRLVYDTLVEENIEKLEANHELDFAYSVKGLARFRFNAYFQKDSVAAALRMIPTAIPEFDSLGLPQVIRDLSKKISGLVLVTGPTGSGKSTTIASMIDDINRNRNGHIMTIEDPVEYVHLHRGCMVNQREVHADTYSFSAALRAVLREDPDIILVGELRDLETIEAALTLAETGHLVFGTLHTRNAPATIDRIVDVFPSGQQAQIRVLLGNTLEGVISQQLLPKLGGGRVAALEIMTGTPAIKSLIREGKTHQMYSVIETNAKLGMVTMDKSLADHNRQGSVSFEECLARAVDVDTFSRLAQNPAA